MRTLVVALLAVSLAFAGCADKGKDDGGGSTSTTSTSVAASTTSTSGSATTTSTSSSTSTSQAPANRAPTGGVAVSLNSTKATFNLTGIDPDGDAITWTLAFGDGNETSGSTLPASIDHEFAPGNYSAHYNLTDGKLATSYSINVSAAVAGAKVLFTFTGSTSQSGNPFTSDGGLVGQQPGLGARACASFVAGDSGVDCVFTPLAADLAGKTYAVTTDAASPDIEFWDACEASGEMTQAHGGPLTGPVPAGSGCVVMWNFGTATASFTFVVTG